MKTPTAPLLKIEGATVRRNGRPILDDVSLEIAEGQHTAIVGPNGSGKTTLIKLISRDHYPLARPNNRPSITLFGEPLWDVFDLRRMMGIVSTDLHVDFLTHREEAGHDLFTSVRGVRELSHQGSGLTGYEAVLSGFFASHGLAANHVVTEDMHRRAGQLLTELEAGHLADKLVNTMSTGEVRRILIARALVPSPRALLLDEPTTGLDFVARRKFLETLRAIAHEKRTIILITHHVEEILPEMDNVVLMKDGKVAEAGTKAKMLTSEKLSDVFGAPVTIKKVGEYYTTELL